MTSYLSNARYLVRNTPRHTEMARRRSQELGRPALAAHFAHKLVEETGHDRWADADLAQMSDLFGSRASERPTAALVELMGYLDQAIQEEPAGYLAYALHAEYFTVLIGPEWVRMLDERCGVPRTAMTVVTKHVTLDQDHVLEGAREIDALVTDPALLPVLQRVLSRAMSYLESFYDQIYEQTQEASELRNVS
ncbi:MAG TPA: hypothetical protein VGI10_21755 [Polyangiaceae bacterium]